MNLLLRVVFNESGLLMRSISFILISNCVFIVLVRKGRALQEQEQKLKCTTFPLAFVV